MHYLVNAERSIGQLVVCHLVVLIDRAQILIAFSHQCSVSVWPLSSLAIYSVPCVHFLGNAEPSTGPLVVGHLVFN